MSREKGVYPMVFPILETERLRLVEIEQSYCQKIYEIFSLMK